jgi:hypothetical protein
MERALLIVWHSRTGGTQAMVGASLEAAREHGPATALRAEDAGAAEMAAAGGILFACPENLGTMSGAMKEFFDRTYYPLLGRIEGKPYAAMFCAGTDGEGASRQLARIALGWRLKKAAEPLIVKTGAQSPEEIAAAKSIGATDLDRCRELGALLSAGIAMGIF